MARQKPTHPDTPDWTLSPHQETAVDSSRQWEDGYRHGRGRRGDPADRERVAQSSPWLSGRAEPPQTGALGRHARRPSQLAAAGRGGAQA